MNMSKSFEYQTKLNFIQYLLSERGLLLYLYRGLLLYPYRGLLLYPHGGLLLYPYGGLLLFPYLLQPLTCSNQETSCTVLQ